MNALILVDLQNDFVSGGALPVPDGRGVVSVANSIQNDFDCIVATQDWHPSEHVSFAENHPGRQPGDVIEVSGQRQVLWPVHCVQSTRGAELLDDLERRRIDRTIHKGTDPRIDSYSGFFENDHFKATGLGDFLREKNVTCVYILGLATDYCVKFTALDARSLGLETYLITDGCRGVGLNPGDIDSAMAQMKDAGIQFVNSTNLEI